MLAGLGREVQSTGLLAADAVEKALEALRRFRALCDTAGVRAAVVRRDRRLPRCRQRAGLHRGGRAHLPQAHRGAVRQARGASCPRSASCPASTGRTASSAISAAARSSWSTCTATRLRHGVTLPLGGLALQDLSAKSIKKAEKIVRKALGGAPHAARTARAARFYAVGGTWRALARLHMWQTGYPLHVMHGYVIPAREALEFSRLVHRVNPEMLSRIEMVTEARRPLLAYAALVLEHIVRIMQADARS